MSFFSFFVLKLAFFGIIKMGDRNVHLYLGRPFRYTCIVSATPLETNKVLNLFRKSV